MLKYIPSEIETASIITFHLNTSYSLVTASAKVSRANPIEYRPHSQLRNPKEEGERKRDVQRAEGEQ